MICATDVATARVQGIDPSAANLCASLVHSADAIGRGPGFAASYAPGESETHVPPALATTAFVYDNALAAIALTGCGQVSRAAKIGDAILVAIHHDRTFRDGRIRNAYKAGAIAGTPALPGWWDASTKTWAEDAYQDSTATGNVAWAALALLTLRQATGHHAYSDGAKVLLDWIDTHTSTTSGYSGGFYGFDNNQKPLLWKSTEHNIDVAAAANWLSELTHDPRCREMSSRARGFVAGAFDGTHFRIGALADGRPNDAPIVLDVQLWPSMALPDAPAQWRRGLSFAEERLSVDGGFSFSGARDGVWTEGTAQAALAYRVAGDQVRAAEILQHLQSARAPSGLLYATRAPRLATGLAIGPDSTKPDFFYFPRPHLGATAWAALAALGWDPFTGKEVN
ncbi:MAG TPA: hypothetical protein VKV77_06880 [Methylovirgula sp.]|nr:hypothetical protein [Methylovirgula sp.]